MNRRNTIQKQLLLDAVKKLDHPTAADILEEIRRTYPSISTGTVYRNVNLLIQEGKVRRLTMPDSPDRYDIELHQHYHMTCARCGRLFNIESPYLAELDRSIEQSTGFTIQGHTIFFKGVCPLCRQQHPNTR